jgi:hypothetical protein
MALSFIWNEFLNTVNEETTGMEIPHRYDTGLNITRTKENSPSQGSIITKVTHRFSRFFEH